MNDIVKTEPLQRLIAQAMSALDNATTAAEILEARVNSAALYDQAKLLERFAQAKNAHEAMMATCRQLMADAALIEARAEVRLADEYDALQARGEVASGRDGPGAGVLDGNAKATAADIGVTRKQVHNARKVRDAEKLEPGVVKRTLDKALTEKRTPLRADVSRAVDNALNKNKPKPAVAAAPRVATPEPAHDEIDWRDFDSEVPGHSGYADDTVMRIDIIPVATKDGKFSHYAVLDAWKDGGAEIGKAKTVDEAKALAQQYVRDNPPEDEDGTDAPSATVPNIDPTTMEKNEIARAVEFISAYTATFTNILGPSVEALSKHNREGKLDTAQWKQVVDVLSHVSKQAQSMFDKFVNSDDASSATTH